MRTLLRITSAALVGLTVAACSSGVATPAATPSPTPGPALTIAYEENAQVELIAPSGERLLIDVFDPTQLTAEAKPADVLLITHMHGDHFLASYGDSFPGQQVVNKNGEFTFGSTRVASIAASHTDDPIVADDPTNHIFVIDFAGFRILHMGSTGQTTLTPEQLKAIGSNVDVMFMTLINVGGADPDNVKELDMVNQVKPRIVVPTHSNLDYIQAAGKQYDTTWSSHKSVTIPKSELPAKTTLLCMGNIAVSYGAILKAPESTW